MANYIEIDDEVAFHPGYYLREYLESEDIPVEQFAAELGMDKHELQFILDGEMSVSEDFAEKLQSTLGVSTVFWLAVQAKYDNFVEEYDGVLQEYEQNHNINKPPMIKHTSLFTIIT